jgi:hypothetical protein
MNRRRDKPPSTYISAGLEVAVALTGTLFLAGALLATQGWWDRHFLPLYFFSHDKYVLGERLARLAVGAAGLLLLFLVRPMVGRATSRMSVGETAATLLRIVLAIGLALAATEWMMGHSFTFAAAETQPGEEPPRQPHPKLGWIFTPAHDGRTIVGDRNIAYSIDPHGYRVASQQTPVDVDRPTILFTGESIIAGYGLNWDETIPAQAGAALNVQSAAIAVFGYANDQAYLRVQSELPRFHRPLAVVSLFIPSLFARNLGDDRPHLVPGLTWMPAVHRLWSGSLLRFAVPYHSEAEIERGIQATRAELIATAALARARGAVALVVDPQYGPETPVERMLRRRILQEPGIDYVRVKLDPDWHLKGDLHPDPRAAHAIAMAIAARLRTNLESRLADDSRPPDEVRSHDDGPAN